MNNYPWSHAIKAKSDNYNYSRGRWRKTRTNLEIAVGGIYRDSNCGGPLGFNRTERKKAKGLKIKYRTGFPSRVKHGEIYARYYADGIFAGQLVLDKK